MTRTRRLPNGDVAPRETPLDVKVGDIVRSDIGTTRRVIHVTDDGFITDDGLLWPKRTPWWEIAKRSKGETLWTQPTSNEATSLLSSPDT